MHAFLIGNFKHGETIVLLHEASHEASKTYTLNKQSQTADKVQSSSFRIVRGANNASPLKQSSMIAKVSVPQTRIYRLNDISNWEWHKVGIREVNVKFSE